MLDFDGQMQTLPGYEEVSAELAVSVLEEGGKFCAGVLEPLNRPADEEGCKLENGLVSTPKGIADAYKAFVEAGWAGLSGAPEFGGQGLPRATQILLDEMLSSANLSFGLFPGLTRGAVEAIEHHASDELKAKYLPKMISGELTRGHGADGIFRRHRSRSAHGPRRARRRRLLQDQGHQDLHLFRRPGFRRQHHPSGARPPARRTEGR
ncbi:hypothetical protein GGQ82_004284 [Sphingobium olei]